MRKQKAGTPNESNIKAPKIPKYTTPSCSQDQDNNPSQSLTQILQSQTQPSYKLINFTQIDNFDQLTEVWNYVKESQITVSQDQNQVRIIEKKELLAQVNSEIESLQKSICQGKNYQEKTAKHIEDRCKIQNAIVEMQNLVMNLNSVIQEHIDALTEQAKYCDEALKYSTNLYNDVDSKQDVIIKNLTEQLNAQESVENEKLENELELLSHELSIRKTEFNKLENEMEEITQLTNNVNTNLEKNEIIIQQNNKKYEDKTAQISESVENTYTNFKDERERKSKFLTENNKSSEKYAELLSKYKVLQIEDAGYLSRIEKSNSTKLELEKKGASVANEFEELKNTHLVFNSNRELEIAEFRTKIQDLSSLSRDGANKLKEAVSTNDELSKTLTQTVEDNEQLKNAFKNKDIEMMKMRTELSDVLVKNTELTANVQRQKDELIAIERAINQNRVDLETCKDKQDEIVKTEAELRAELATIEIELSDKHEDLLGLIKKASDEKLKSLKQLEKLESIVKDKNSSIARGEKCVKDLQREIRRSQLEWNKKLKDATHSLKQYRIAANKIQIGDQNTKIDDLKQELAAEKLRQKRASDKKNAARNKEREKYEAELRRMKFAYGNSKDELATLKHSNEDLLRKLKEAEASSEAKNAKQKRTVATSTPKPILKSPFRESPLKVQKVQFKFGTSSEVNSVKSAGYWEEAERRYAATAAKNRVDWSKVQIVTSSQEADTTAPVVTQTRPKPQTQQVQARKFFKQPRMEIKKTSKFGRK